MEQIEPTLRCKVCGEGKFKLREGFYYCEECGTKHEQIRAIEVEQEDDFNEGVKHVKKQKIHTLKTEKPELTSWECYNYILRGLVEEILSMGAKEELKLMTLQVWAAYLRLNEVAFFNKKHAELPKLGVRFLKRDSKTLYNHCQERRRKRQRRRTEDSSIKSGESTSTREWRKNKRKLDESEYSIHSATTQSRDTESQFSGNTTSTGTTTRAIQLKFSSMARRQYKKIMPIRHLQKHEKDSQGTLTCHKICPRVREINRFDHAVTNLTIKQIYAIISISLNLVEDEMQLCDLLRFIDEERVGTRNVLQYFPENIAPHCKAILKEIGFYGHPSKFTYKLLREQVSWFQRFLHINEFKKPDIHKLALRYITDLNLPEEVGSFVERLINLLPPQMQTRTMSNYPAYEARAMAYIVFILKLLFGLDGHKEKLISNSAIKINSKISDLKDGDDQQEQVFVWTEWMEFIEMRKVIVSQYNSSFCSQYNQCQTTAHLLAELNEELQRQHNAATDEENLQNSVNSRVANMKRIFENFQQNYDKAPPEQVETISFPPSYTPAHSYFKRILLHVSSGGSSTVIIPEFMRIDHTQRSMKCFLRPKSLRDFFSNRGMNLKIIKAPCTSDRCFAGVFRKRPDSKAGAMKMIQANFKVTEKRWLEEIKNEPQVEELEFKTEMESYHKATIRRMEVKRARQSSKNVQTNDWAQTGQKSMKGVVVGEISASDFLLPSSEFRQKLNARKTNDNDDILSLHSIDVFKECDMEPIENLNLTEPRRRFDGVQLFKDVSSDESSGNEAEESGSERPLLDTQSNLAIKKELLSQERESNTLTFVTSNLDYWTLIGYINMLNDIQKKILEKKFSRSFIWLLETCAQTIGVDWSLVYEQLLIIECMFVYGIESLDNLQDCIKFKSNIHIRDINHLIQLFREIW